MTAQDDVNRMQTHVRALLDEVGRVIVGQQSVVRDVVIGLLAGGNVLLEGLPGLGKTLLVKTLARALQLDFRRVQFTPDLMPADILGTFIVMEDGKGGKRFEFQKGPIFGNIILADEINRATPKTQSALLEAMQEHAVTMAGQAHALPEPFFVLATQNPIDMEGTYPLPEAQLDRFLFLIEVGAGSAADLVAVLQRTTAGDTPEARPVMTGADLLKYQALIRQTPAADEVLHYAARLVLATHPATTTIHEVKQYVRFGASARGAQALTLAAKAAALLRGGNHVTFDDVRGVALPALRHRLIRNFQAEADGVRAEAIVNAVLKQVPQAV